MEFFKPRDMVKTLMALFVLVFTFLIYLDTMAPTVSFWDCGEFIAVSHTLSVPHPPGSPLYLLLGRVISMLPITGGAALDPVLNEPQFHNIAFRINLLSPIATALSNMFLFLIIVRLVAEYRGKIKDATDKWIAYGGGLVGSLTIAFSDSHWFNAVEAEVYSMSIFFTAIVVWLILKWSEKVDEGGAGVRYILIISYMMGLAISVHMLNLLTIPFIALIMYIKLNPKEDGVEMMLHMLSVVAIMAIALLIGVEMALPATSGEYMRLAASDLSSKLMVLGVIFAIITGGGLWGLSQAFKGDRRNRFWKQVLLMGAAGGSYLIIYLGIIKGMPKLANFMGHILNTDNAVSAIGTTFALSIIMLMALIYFAPSIYRGRATEIRLAVMALLMVLVGFTSYETIFIRSSQNPNIDENDPETVSRAVSYLEREQYGSYPMFYRDRWSETPLNRNTATPGRIVKINSTGKIGEVISMNGDQVVVGVGGRDVNQRLSNLSVINNGYRSSSEFFWRYQINHMYIRYFKWQFWGRHGDNSDISQLWAIPFLLGLAGLGHHFSKDSRRAFAVLALFMLTGFAILLYLNQDDPQPRERDYSYVGSFYAFAIWIGIGAAALLEKLKDWRKDSPLYMGSAVAIMLLAAPVNMLRANYHTHDRSGNYVAWEYSYNLLNTCDPNAIIFTNGDNDTFPLWYLQEVEGIRTDVRVVNLSLLNTPWYIKQLKHMEPKVPISLNDEEIEGMGLWRWEERQMTLPGPATPGDKAEVGSLEQGSAGITWNLQPTISRQKSPQTGKLIGGLRVQDIMIFDILRMNEWKQPVYFAVTVSPSNQIGLEDYLRMDGQAYQLVPYKVGLGIDIDVMYDKIINTYRYTNLDDPNVYYPPNVQRLLQNYRKGFLQLVYEYGLEGDENREKALFILHKMDELVPDNTIPVTYMDLYLQIAQMYYQLEDDSSAYRYMENAFKNGREDSPLMDRVKVASIWNDLFDETEKALDILLPLSMEAPNNAQVIYEIARAYVKAGDVIDGEEWVSRLAVLAPMARETRTLQDQVNKLKADTTNS
ncbi:MAG: DUF2723 domain-containing protein [Candidatus Marinimicrobia bacterium]|nr:DUF2723 domain-containing protein [Candidatus Neomarinimicrobiota bacterium]MCF7921647.1 DUF2723 domain-containing protein [Candidatus Neomarinimicrobiota bacterium]